MGGMTKPGSQRAAAKTSTRELVNEKQLSEPLAGHPFCSIFSEAEIELLAVALFKISKSLFSLCHPPNILSVDVLSIIRREELTG